MAVVHAAVAVAVVAQLALADQHDAADAARSGRCGGAATVQTMCGGSLNGGHGYCGDGRTAAEGATVAVELLAPGQGRV